MRNHVSTGASAALFGALALLGGCKAVGLSAPQAVTSEEVLGKLEATPAHGPAAPEVVALPPAPAPVTAPYPPQPAVLPASRPVSEGALDEDRAVPATLGASKSHPREKTKEAPPAQAAGGRTHKVQRGETLQKISLKYYGTTTKWMKIYEANKAKIKRPDLITVGTVLTIP
jgi:nucleoid-associated protein YgaU